MSRMLIEPAQHPRPPQIPITPRPRNPPLHQRRYFHVFCMFVDLLSPHPLSSANDTSGVLADLPLPYKPAAGAGKRRNGGGQRALETRLWCGDVWLHSQLPRGKHPTPPTHLAEIRLRALPTPGSPAPSHYPAFLQSTLRLLTHSYCVQFLPLDNWTSWPILVSACA